MKVLILLSSATLSTILACSNASEVAGVDKRITARANALSSTDNEQDVPFAFVGPNPCNGDDVVLDGTSHFVTHLTLNTAGLTPGFHLETHVQSRASGTDVLITKNYSGMTDDNFIVEVPDPTATETEESMLQIRGPDSGDDFFMHLVFKFTVNANSVPTAAVDRPTAKCK